MTLFRVTGQHPSNGEGEMCTVETDTPEKAEAYYRLAAGGIPSSWTVSVTPVITLQMPLPDWEASFQNSPSAMILPNPPESINRAILPVFAVEQIEADTE